MLDFSQYEYLFPQEHRGRLHEIAQRHNQLTEQYDEVIRAHSDNLEALLQLLDEACRHPANRNTQMADALETLKPLVQRTKEVMDATARMSGKVVKAQGFSGKGH